MGGFGALRAIAVDGLAFAARSGEFPNCLIFSFSCSVSVLVLAVDGGDLWDRLIPNRASYMKSCIADHVGCVIFLCRDGRETVPNCSSVRLATGQPVASELQFRPFASGLRSC